jgi:hypothetical protein
MKDYALISGIYIISVTNYKSDGMKKKRNARKLVYQSRYIKNLKGRPGAEPGPFVS